MVNTSIIVDTKRRSTSYEHRLCKYWKRGYRIIFPGLDKNIDYIKLGTSALPEEDLKTNLMRFIKMCGYDINNVINIINECRKVYPIKTESINCINLFPITNEMNVRLNNKDNLSQQSLNRISDYNDDNSMLSLENNLTSNLIKLRLGNLNSVQTMIYISEDDPYDKQKINDILVNDIDSPNLAIGLINKYPDYAHKNRLVTINTYYAQPIHNQKLIKIFGSFTNEVKNIRLDEDKYNEYINKMINITFENAKICTEKLKGIKWITKNPGRQWTSSNNPIVANPRDWYGERYIPLKTGIPKRIESCLRLARLRSIWNMLNDDIFNLILLYINKNFADKAWKYIYIRYIKIRRLLKKNIFVNIFFSLYEISSL